MDICWRNCLSNSPFIHYEACHWDVVVEGVFLNYKFL